MPEVGALICRASRPLCARSRSNFAFARLRCLATMSASAAVIVGLRLGFGLAQLQLAIRHYQLRLLELQLRHQVALSEIELRAIQVVPRLHHRRLVLLLRDLLLRLHLRDLGVGLLQLRELLLHPLLQRRRIELDEHVAGLHGRPVFCQLDDLELARLRRRREHDRLRRPDVPAELEVVDEVSPHDVDHGDIGRNVRARRHHETAGDHDDATAATIAMRLLTKRRKVITSACPIFLRDDVPLGEALRDDRLVGVRAGQRDVLSFEAPATLHPDESLRALVRDRVERDDERAGRARELHVERRREVRHEVRMRAVDADEDDEIPDLRREIRLNADRRDLIDVSGKLQVRIGVQADAYGLTDAQLVDVGLIHPSAHPHRRRIHDIDDGDAGANLVAFLDFRHVAVLPGRLDHGNAVDRGLDEHAIGVRGGLLHRGLGAVAANLENLDVGGSRLAFEVIGLLQLNELGTRFLESKQVLFSLDLRDHLVLHDLELGTLLCAFGLLERAVVRRFRGVLLRAPLANLLFEIVQLRLLVERVAICSCRSNSTSRSP